MTSRIVTTLYNRLLLKLLVPLRGSSMDRPLVMDLRKVSRNVISLVGGKATTLGELLASGFPVPPGFVVTTAAYEAFVSRNRLDEVIARALRKRPVDDEAVRRAFLTAPIPEEVVQAIRAAYQAMGLWSRCRTLERNSRRSA
jgi:pyruvate,water dikinase